MLNIAILCTPNYTKKRIVNSVPKSIDVVSQFVALYHSIKKNWKSFDYKIHLFCNERNPFNKRDRKKLNQLDIAIHMIKEDYEAKSEDRRTPFMLRCNILNYNFGDDSSHILILDPDMLALNEPTFDFNCDWQAMFGGKLLDEGDSCNNFHYINRRFNFNLDFSSYSRNNPYSRYASGAPLETIFPYFNGGAYLIRRSLAAEFSKWVRPCYAMCHFKCLRSNTRHVGIEYGISFALIKISSNWKPFELGFNLLIKEDSTNRQSFEVDDIQLLHYAGIGAGELVKKEFNEYFEVS